MKNADISVIVPIYNCEKFLAECLNSLQSQSFGNIEILCVNDGSTDNSLKIMREYAKKDKRIKILNQKNQGQSVARNNAIKKASGKYLAFIDADDYINDCFLEELHSAAIAENADIAVGNIIRVKDGCKNEPILYYKKVQTAHKTDDIFRLLGIPKNCYTCNRLYRRDFIMTNSLFFKESVIFEDVIWSTLAAYNAKKVVSVPKADYYYVYNEDSSVNTTEISPEKIKNRRDAFMFYNHFIFEHKIKAPVRWEKISKLHFCGLPLLKIKEVPGFLKRYYFCGLCIASIETKHNF